MPAQAEQRKLIGLSPNHHEKDSLKVSLGTKEWDFSSSAAVPGGNKRKVTREIVEIRDEPEEKRECGAGGGRVCVCEDLTWVVAGFDVL